MGAESEWRMRQSTERTESIVSVDEGWCFTMIAGLFLLFKNRRSSLTVLHACSAMMHAAMLRLTEYPINGQM